MTLPGAAQPAPAKSLQNLSGNFMLGLKGRNAGELSEIMINFQSSVICDKSLPIVRGSPLLKGLKKERKEKEKAQRADEAL